MAESKNRSFCSVPECSCSAKKQPYLSFHCFPRDQERKSKWLQAIRRDEGAGFKVLRGSTYVCSRHFTTEDYVKAGSSRLKNGAIPSRFSWNNFVASQKTSSKRVSASASSSADFSGEDATYTPLLDHDYVSQPPAGKKRCNIRFYTKFPSEDVFRIFWESINPSASRLVHWTKAKRMARSMPLIDEFLMYCMRVAVGMKEQLIADMFNVSIAAVSRVTITWANYLFIILSYLPIWISREKVKSSLPLKFRKHCPTVRVILDCTEIAIDTSSSLTLQSETFSNYKNRTTLKGLIGVAPCGLITFISPLYAGSISEKAITRSSGVLSLLEKGDDIMAHEGFLIQDLLDGVGARLIIPPFKHGAQFTKEEAEQTKAIACLRTTVEKVIARVKSFHIWDSPVPLTLIGCVNQLWHNCCVLANYQGPLCFEQ
ncbi:hypothetical protein Q5P01_023225 [Channa striata]|uniref:THAP-type domain-containing protein n=1 Tax=Channa striata TaxID=64152 RepID=A0AA88LQU6_CHASR|nr:hypothetical protein Q5P01_023225 [Channa striata]